MLFTIGEIIKLTRSLQGHSSAVYSCQFSPNFEHIITGLDAIMLCIITTVISIIP